MNDLDQAALQRRSDELDAHQRFLDTQIEYLEKSPITVKTYEAQILAKSEQLDEIQKNINIEGSRLSQTIKDYEYKINQQRKLLSVCENELLESQNRLISTNNNIKEAEKTLRSIDKDISSRDVYKEKQEKDIARAANDGNDHLTNLRNLSVSIENELYNLKSDKITLEGEVNNLTILRGELEDEVSTLDDEISSRQTRLSSELNGITKKLGEKTKQLQAMDENYNNQMVELETKELSIKVQKDELLLIQQEITEEKRRWEATKSLYN